SRRNLQLPQPVTGAGPARGGRSIRDLSGAAQYRGDRTASLPCCASPRVRHFPFRTVWATNHGPPEIAGACIRRNTTEDSQMDRLEKYREIVRRVIREYASYKPSNGNIDAEPVEDRERDHYEVMHIGWDGERRVHGAIIHIDIIGNKVWIQYDG